MQWLIRLMIGVMLTTVGVADELDQFVLDNGLQVYILSDHNAPIVSVRTFVKAGSVTEGKILGSGVSHYLEHIVAGGTTKMRTEKAYQDLIANFGGAFNAYTTYDHTSYFLDTTQDHSLDAIQVMYEWMFFNTMNQTEIDRERGVVHKEMERSDANVDSTFYFASQEKLYKESPLNLPILGRRDRFDALTRRDIQGYYKRFYVPANMVLVVGGNIDRDAVIKKIKQTFGTRPYVQPPAQAFFEEGMPIVNRQAVYYGNTTFSKVSWKFLTTDIADADLYALDLLAFILGQGRQSVLNEAMIQDQQLVNSVSAISYTPVFAPGYFGIHFETEPGNIAAASEQLRMELAQIRRGRIDKKRLARAKQQKLATQKRSAKSIQARVSRVGRSHLIDGSPDFDDRYAELFEALTAKDLARVANEYLDESAMAVTIMHPEEHREGAQEVASPVAETLSNGTQVVMIADTKAPYVGISLQFLTGVRDETITNNGLTTLTQRVFGREKKGLIETAEDLGASAGMSVGYDATSISIECLPEQLPMLWPKLVGAMMMPKPDPTLVDTEKELQLSAIQKREESWSSDAFYQVRQQFFAGHPYAFATDGELDAVRELQAGHVANRLADIIQQKMVVSVTGQFDPAQIKPMLEAAFGTMTPSDGSAPNPRGFQSGQNEFDLFLKQPVSAVIVAVDAGSFFDPDEQVKMDLVDSVLGGMRYPGGRLHPLLRGKEAVYVVHSINRTMLDAGYFVIYALTSPDRMTEVKTDILAELNKLKTGMVSKSELKRAKAQVRYEYLDRQTPISSQAHEMGRALLFGLPETVRDEQLQTLDELTARDVKETAELLFQNIQVFEFNRPSE